MASNQNIDSRYSGFVSSSQLKESGLYNTIVHRMSLDVGFGDVVTPAPQSLDFPLLLSDLPSINISAYSLETVIAEKLHAMIDRDLANSRMKDFFDCYQILTREHIDNQVLGEVILQTFSNRNLPVNPELKLFSDEFVSDKIMQSRWLGFLRKIKWDEKIEFAKVMYLIKSRLQSFYLEYVTISNAFGPESSSDNNEISNISGKKS
ncbi:MAG: nucleotidyl transferase AbiEii/AbiGii toxin family protein [Clostridium sp.]|nr:nucleotidyl transferase AbiEii/AbiGii toxin family protein [Clostridium sp.]